MVATKSMPGRLYIREEIEAPSSDQGPLSRHVEGASAGKLKIPFLIIS